MSARCRICGEWRDVHGGLCAVCAAIFEHFVRGGVPPTGEQP